MFIKIHFKRYSITGTIKERAGTCAHVSGNFTQTSAKKHFGLHNMNQRILEIERCIGEAKLIRETIEEMAQALLKSLLKNVM